MSTVATVLATLRTRLRETTARTWTDAEMIVQISDAEQWLADLIGKLEGSGKYRYTQEFTVAASTETYTLSGLTKVFAELKALGMVVASGIPIPVPEMDDADEFTLRGPVGWAPSGLVVPHYRLLDDTIQFLPVGATTRTFRVTYRYLPTVKTVTGDTLETPPREDPALVVRAAHFLRANPGESNSAFDEEYATLINEIECRWQGRSHGSNAETVARRSNHFAGL